MTFYEQLVENGYRPRDLDNLSQDQLALLVQEEHVENTWSPEARAAAARARTKNKGLKGSQHGQQKRQYLAAKLRGERTRIRTIFRTSRGAGTKSKQELEKFHADLRKHVAESHARRSGIQD